MSAITQPRANPFSALRHANFRLYFAGQLISTSGTWMQNIAQGFLVFKLTGSELSLGLVACAAGLPILLFSPIAGVYVERMPRRQLMLTTQFIQMLLAFVLTGLVAANIVQAWHVVSLAFLLGVTNAFDSPARLTFIVEMVSKEDLPSGITINSILNSGSRVFGPAAAGLALVAVGPATCFFLNGLSFLAVIISLLIMHVPYAVKEYRQSRPVQQLAEGLRFARQSVEIAPLLLIIGVVGFFSLPIITQLPAFADRVLHSPKEGYSAMTTAQGIGSVISGLFVTFAGRRLGRGRLVLATMLLNGGVIALMSQQASIPAAAVMIGLSGLFLVSHNVTINTLVQNSVPNEFRGRILALYTLAFFGFQPFGALLLGFICEYVGTPNGFLLYALAGMVGTGLILLRWPNVVQQR